MGINKTDFSVYLFRVLTLVYLISRNITIMWIQPLSLYPLANNNNLQFIMITRKENISNGTISGY